MIMIVVALVVKVVERRRYRCCWYLRWLEDDAAFIAFTANVRVREHGRVGLVFVARRCRGGLSWWTVVAVAYLL